jgi:TrmH family RNA methyltransferase
MREIITSLHNPRVKLLRKLIDKSSARKEEQLFVVEGLRECSLALNGGYEPVHLYICESLLAANPGTGYDNVKQLVQNTERKPNGPTLTFVSEEIYKQAAYRESTEGIIALIRPKELWLQSLQLSANPLILVLEGVEKPGNIGAMLRTCDAVRADAIIICDPKCDVYNPNAIRSSIGTVFTNQIALCNWSEAALFFKEKGITTYAAELTSSDWYYNYDYRHNSGD